MLERAKIIREQTIDHIGAEGHGRAIEPPPAIIAGEHRTVADIEARLARFSQNIGEGGHVFDAEVEALPGNRVDAVGRISSQRKTLCHQLRRVHQRQRIALPRRGQAQLAKVITNALAGRREERLLIHRR